MHSYRPYKGGFEVFYDLPINDHAPCVLKQFASERQAVAYIHYLNGGDVTPDMWLSFFSN
jgi:hypothetical protein